MNATRLNAVALWREHTRESARARTNMFHPRRIERQRRKKPNDRREIENESHGWRCVLLASESLSRSMIRCTSMRESLVRFFSCCLAVLFGDFDLRLGTGNMNYLILCYFFLFRGRWCCRCCAVGRRRGRCTVRFSVRNFKFKYCCWFRNKVEK